MRRVLPWLLLALLAGAAPAAAATPRCYGAASMDPLHPCVNPDLRLAVVPTPDDALITPNAPCRVLPTLGLLRPCAFGVRRHSAATIALVGDSHASHWRAGLEVVARTKHWRGISLTHSSCPFSQAIKALSGAERARCVRWNRDVLRWFTHHPEVRTVFVGEHTGRIGVVRHGGDRDSVEVAGFAAAWKRLPKTVRHIVVLRDNPEWKPDMAACVRAALAGHVAAGPACARPRDSVLRRDPAAEAASRPGWKRVRLADFTPFFCDAALCYPVIGGALVYKDQTHLTQAYATSLGPYLLRAYNALW